MIQHNAEHYEAVQTYPILKGYLEHFREVSKNNEIPGLLSFFFIQGQAALPYVRIPVGASNIDPRVSIFWIQDTRTGKSVAFEIIEKVMTDCGLDCIDYTTGTDAAMVGSWTTAIEDGDEVKRKTPGVLAGLKGVNFDEGSIILKPSQHSEQTVLFLQSALNSAGTGRNVLTKHMKDGTITIESLVSLWITTFPPKGIKEHVLDKGIFQRVLVYWRHWTLEMKREVAHELAAAVHKKPSFTISYENITDYFKELQTRLVERCCKLNGIGTTDWDEAGLASKAEDEAVCKQQEDWTMAVMREMFTIDDSYIPALIQAIDEYYNIVENMDPKKQGVCASFIMGLQNYTNVIAHHMAMIEGVWVVTGQHIDMAKEILFDLYQNLIHWLESEVKVGMQAAEARQVEKTWKDVYYRTEQFDFDGHRGANWVRKTEMLTNFGTAQNLTSPTSINNRFTQVGSKMFEPTKEGRHKYLRLKDEYRSNKGNA
jgi:hypothetical protein